MMMRHCVLALRQPLLLRRLSTGPRGGGAGEKTTTTPPPVAAEVIYNNPEAVANRLRLFHLMRLQVQARLDLPHLQEMAAMHATNELHQGPLVRVATQYCSGVPGCERQFDPTTAVVRVKVAVGELPVHANRLRRVLAKRTTTEAQLSRSRRYLMLTAGQFPFQSQNRLGAAQLLRDLITEARTSVTPHPTREAAERPEYLKRRRRRPTLTFPSHWLSSPSPDTHAAAAATTP